MYDIELKSIRFSPGKRHHFPGDIAEILDFEDSIIVRLSPGPQVPLQNIFALDYQGNLLWQIPQPLSYRMHSPYVTIARSGGFVEAVNWDGRIVTVHPGNGHIISESISSHGIVSSRRTASVRHWL